MICVWTNVNVFFTMKSRAIIAATTLLVAVMWVLKRRKNTVDRLDFESEADSLGLCDILELRKQFLCSAQSISYANSGPLMLMRGEGQYLFDSEGIAYLDTRNNVPHVGYVCVLSR